MKTDPKQLMENAMKAREMAYAPYSNFKVGAALLTGDGEIVRGCNVENAGYSATNCAERTAIFKAVSEGKRDFRAIAIVGGSDGEELRFCPPCGTCRQVMMEFCNPDSFQIVLGTSLDTIQVFTLKELLPYGFGREQLSDI